MTTVDHSGGRAAIRRVCFTGGPCGGKTAAVNWLRHRYENAFFAVPEVASFCMTIGIRRDTPAERIALHKVILSTQVELQSSISDIAQDFGRWVLLDRSAIDCFAYVNKIEDLALRDEFDNLRVWYDIVFHMCSLAKAMPSLYAKSDANHRIEDPNLAVEIDQRIGRLWTGHKGYYYIQPAETFEKRMEQVLSVLEAHGFS